MQIQVTKFVGKTPVDPKRYRVSLPAGAETKQSKKERLPRRCRTCGLDANDGPWKKWHPYDTSQPGKHVKCITPEDEREEGFPCTSDRMPKRKKGQFRS